MKIGLQTWGSNGDVRPFLALANGLSNAGHQVSLVVTSSDKRDYSGYSKEIGVPITHVGALPYDDETMHSVCEKLFNLKLPLNQLDNILTNFFNPLVPDMYEASQQLCQENDAIICHFFHYPAMVAAEKAGIPYGTVTLNPSHIPSKHSVPLGSINIGSWLNPLWWKIANHLTDRVAGNAINKFRKRQELAPIKNVMETVWASQQLNLLAVSKEICIKQPDWHDYHQICGFFNVPKSAENWTMPMELRKFIDAGSPPVFITLGSMVAYDRAPLAITEMVVQAAALADCRAIVQSRWDGLQDFPDHPHIFKLQDAPHQSIFPHCAAVIHHGGSGTTHSATLHGCPSIVIEHFGDQMFFALELKRLGVAHAPLHRRNVTAKKLAKAIRKVLDSPGMKQKAEELGAFMKKENGVTMAAQLIEERFQNC